MTRLEILKSLAQGSANQEFSYSAMMRKIRKEHPDKVNDFLKAFKTAFDEAISQDIESVEETALMQAVKMIGL